VRKWGGTAEDARKLPYPETYAWVLKGAKRFRKPIPYEHPSGPVIWVTLRRSALGRSVTRKNTVVDD
jgi:hypothetical protein